MTKPPLLDRETLMRAFEALASRLARRGVRADVYVFDGAAMILAYGANRATRDVDAVFEPHDPVLQEAHAVAKALGLPPSWLNEQASAYLSQQADCGAAPVFDHAHLRVSAASAQHLVAMKALSARRHDLDDLRLLADHLGLRTAASVQSIVAVVFPNEVLDARKRLLIEDLFNRSAS